MVANWVRSLLTAWWTEERTSVGSGMNGPVPDEVATPFYDDVAARFDLPRSRECERRRHDVKAVDGDRSSSVEVDEQCAPITSGLLTRGSRPDQVPHAVNAVSVEWRPFIGTVPATTRCLLLYPVTRARARGGPA